MFQNSLITVTPEAFEKPLLDVNLVKLHRRSCLIDLTDTRSIEECRKTITRMHNILKHLPAGALAAPQIGITLRLVLAPLIQRKPKQLVALINPHIIQQSVEEKEDAEACFSIPGFYGRVCRATQVLVRAYDLSGKECYYDESGFMARMLQHEIDHLDGVLYPDRMKPGECLIRYR